ncbi:MAG TPA: hypothetical protein VGB38_08700, partial [bacterium]
MKTLAVFLKTMREQLRDWPSLFMVLVLCPFFVFLYWLMSGGGSTTYKILLLNRDRGVLTAGQTRLFEGKKVEAALKGLRYPNGAAMVKLAAVHDRKAAEVKLKDRQAAVLLVLPEAFSEALHTESPLESDMKAVSVTVAGDAANPAYAVASVLALTAADQVVRAVSGVRMPVDWTEEFVSANRPRTEFEMYVPGLLILSVMLLIFTTAL